MSLFPQPGEYKPTAFEIWMGNHLKNAFNRAAIHIGIYPVSTMVAPLKAAIAADDGAGVDAILKKCPKAAHAELDVLIREPFRYALSLEKYGAARAILSACPAVLTERDYFGRTALVDLADSYNQEAQKDLRVAQELVKMGAAVDDQDGEGKTALHRAVSRKSAELANFFIASGAAVEARDKWGETPLMIAACRGSAETLSLLLEHGADIRAKSDSGFNAVNYAIHWRQFDSALWLMEQGGTVNFAAQGFTDPQEDAAKGGKTAFIGAFLRQKAAWEQEQKEAGIDSAVQAIEGGLDHSVNVHPIHFRTKTPAKRRWW